MKVAHVVSVFPPYRSGIGTSAYHISWELSNLGDDVTVFTTTRSGNDAIDQTLPFKVVRLRPFFSYGNAGFVPQLLLMLRGFDIIHLHYPFFGGAEMVYFRDRLRALNLIVHYHMDVYGEGMMRRMFAWHSNHVMPRILQRAQRIVVTSFDYARQSKLKGLLADDPDKFIAIPLGVNPMIFKPRIRNKELVAKHELANKQVVLFVGGLDRAHYFKGVNYLIKAFQLIASNDDFRLVIVGGGDMRSSYQTLAHNFGLERKVVFAGAVSDDVLPFYYNLADVFVLPSIDSSEAFGIAIVEAMASGTAVIASDLPGVRSVVLKGKTGLLVKTKNAGALARYLRYLLENPQVRNKYGAAGRARVLQHYTWESIGKRIHKLYTEKTG